VTGQFSGDIMKNVKLLITVRLWPKLLIAGIVLFSVTMMACYFTGISNLFPTLLLLGAFTVPVAFVVFVYEHELYKEVPMTSLTTGFLAGGVIGVISAGVIEFETFQSASVMGLLLVGITEESCKLILPMFQYFRKRYRHQADGLLFGVAAGMGFAALETMGYGMTAAMKSGGDVTSISQMLLIRGLLSPAGHTAWTGIVAAVMWRERERKGRGLFSPAVLLAFAGVILVHFSWNFVNSLARTTHVSYIIIGFALSIISVSSLILLVRLMNEANGLWKMFGNGTGEFIDSG
jgi:RsiW-degrading membrane proteinase PrsW (M82 family)